MKVSLCFFQVFYFSYKIPIPQLSLAQNLKDISLTHFSLFVPAPNLVTILLRKVRFCLLIFVLVVKYPDLISLAKDNEK